MLLQIQLDESLTSFVRRNLFLNRYAPAVEIFEDLAKRPAFRSAEIKMIASAIGWPGCYGFNRLIHHHTLLAATYVIKNGQDVSYSEKQYASMGSPYSDWSASYCPDCVKEDLENLGFSYWKRFCSPYIKVCYKHNVVLLDSCHFCGKSFSRLGHNLDVMWRKCGNRHLGDAPSIPNEDSMELRRAVAFHRICLSPYHISDEGALCVLRDKAASLISILPENLVSKMRSEFRNLGGNLEILKKCRLSNNANRLKGLNLKIIGSIATIYEFFDDFLMDLKSQELDIRPINSQWATYQAGGMESAYFVEENYVSGIGHWFCPYPSSQSGQERSHDGYDRRRPKQYPCCNFPHLKDKGQMLKVAKVGEALPRVPKISREDARAIGIVV